MINIREITPTILFGDTEGPGPNILFIKTPAGIVLVDTTESTDIMQQALDQANLAAGDISLVLLTHADPDHILGNGLFSCPIIAHEKTLERMKSFENLPLTYPTETFSGDSHTIEFGGVQIEMHFVGGHKSDMNMVWLPQEKVLLASDIIFKGRYPFMIGSIVPTWIKVLKSLPEYPAEVILPGHGTICNQADIDLLINYMETTWRLVNQYYRQGKSPEEILAAPEMPKVAEWVKEDFFERNIVYMLECISESEQ